MRTQLFQDKTVWLESSDFVCSTIILSNSLINSHAKPNYEILLFVACLMDMLWSFLYIGNFLHSHIMRKNSKCKEKKICRIRSYGMDLWHLVHSYMFLYPAILTFAVWRQFLWLLCHMAILYLLLSQWQSQLHPFWHLILLQSEHTFCLKEIELFMILITLSS